MKYRISRVLEQVQSGSYLKDEGAVLADDVIDCSLGVNPYGVTPTLTKEVYLETFGDLSRYPDYPYSTDCRKFVNIFLIWRRCLPGKSVCSRGRCRRCALLIIFFGRKYACPDSGTLFFFLCISCAALRCSD